MRTVILRLNLDLEVSEIKNSLRLTRAIQSVKENLKKYDKVVILSHRGRPDGFDKELSLEPVCIALGKSLRKNIPLLDCRELSLAEAAIEEGKKGSVFMIENLRFLEGESSCSVSLSEELAALGDVFINDDFATAHRKAASNVGIVKYMKKSMMGSVLKEELRSLDKVMRAKKGDIVLIVGGAKIADKVSMIANLLPKCSAVLLGGGAGNTAMKAMGYDIGSSISDDKMIPVVKKLIKSGKVSYPCDFRMRRGAILDIGPNTARGYGEIIKGASIVVWAGPMGKFEEEAYSRGSIAIAKAIAASKSYSVIGGGETGAVVTKAGVANKINFLSTGGSAMLEYLSGYKLPAVEAIVRLRPSAKSSKKKSKKK